MTAGNNLDLRGQLFEAIDVSECKWRDKRAEYIDRDCRSGWPAGSGSAACAACTA